MANRNPKLMMGPDTAAAETGLPRRRPDTASAETGPSPRRHLLLHACCGPCSTHCVHTVREQGYEPVLFFSNSNIDTEEEFERRLAALRNFARAVGVEVLVDPYDPGSWRRATAGLDRGSIQAALRKVTRQCGLKKTSPPTACATAMPPT